MHTNGPHASLRRLSACGAFVRQSCASLRCQNLLYLRPDLFFPHPKFSCCNAISEDAMAEARLVEAVGDGVAGRLVHRVRPKGATLLA